LGSVHPGVCVAQCPRTFAGLAMRNQAGKCHLASHAKELLVTNPSLIDILAIVDTVTLAALVADGTLRPGTAGNPLWLNEQTQSSVLVTLMTQGSFVSNTSEGVLAVGANSSSRLRWAISSLDSNGAFTPYFCRGLFVYYPAT